jgi:hypothetical protein
MKKWRKLACMGLCALVGLYLPACNGSDDDEEVIEETVTPSHHGSSRSAPTNTVPDAPTDPLAGLCLPAWTPAPARNDGSSIDVTNIIVVTEENIPLPNGGSERTHTEVAFNSSPTETYSSTNIIRTTTEIISLPSGDSEITCTVQTFLSASSILVFSDGTTYWSHRDSSSICITVNGNESCTADDNLDETITALDGAICAGNEVISTVPGSAPVTQFTAHVECPGGAVTVIDRATFNLIKAKLGL